MVEEENIPAAFELEEEKEFHKQPPTDLIKKCLYDPSLSIERTRACRDLAYECRKNMNTELTLEERNQLRQNILDETTFQHDTSPRKPEVGSNEKTEVEISGKNFVVPQRLPTILDYGYDSEKYINEKRKEPFGYCSLAMYGIENQYYDIINDTPMQPKKQAEYIEQAERLIFQEDNMAQVVEQHDYGKLWNDMDLHKKKLIIDKFRPPGLIAPSLRVPLYQYEDKEFILKIQNYLAKNTDWKELEKLYPNRHYTDLYVETINNEWFKKCDPLDYNPFVKSGKYRYCTTADLSDVGSGDRKGNLQRIQIEKKELMEREHLAPRIMEHASAMSFQELWKYIPQNIREEIIKHTSKINLPLEERRAIEGNLNSVSTEELNSIWHTLFQKYTPDQLLKVLEDRPAQYEWKLSGNTLSCWHNQIEYFYTKEAIAKRIDDLTELLNKGEIEYTYYEMEVKKLNDIAEVVSSDKPTAPPAYFVQKSSYMPIRHRIHFSQSAIDSILQYKIYDPTYRLDYDDLGADEQNLHEPISDNYTVEFIEGAFNEKELQQMTDHKLYSDEDMERLVLFKDINASNLWELLQKSVDKIILENTEEKNIISDYISELNSNVNYGSLKEMDLLELVLKGFKIPPYELKQFIQMIPSNEVELNEGAIVVDEYTYDTNYTWQLDDDGKKDYAKMFEYEIRKQEFLDIPKSLKNKPILTEADIQRIFFDNDENEYEFEVELPFKVVMDYDDLEKLVKEKINEKGDLGIHSKHDFYEKLGLNDATRSLAFFANKAGKEPFQG